MANLITKDNMTAIAARMQAFGQKIQPELVVSVDTELDAKQGNFGIYLYFSDAAQEAAIDKALKAIMKQVKAGTLGQEEPAPASAPAPKRPVKASVAEVEVEVEEEPVPEVDEAAEEIVDLFSEYSLECTAEQVSAALAGGTAIDKKIAKVAANPELLALAAKKKVPMIYVLLQLVAYENLAEDERVSKGMANAAKKLPMLVFDESEAE